jgi:hypothetical protein
MQKRRATGRGSVVTEAYGVNGGLPAAVADLGRRFAAFRKRNRAHTRIPADLQDAVASAVCEGAAEEDLLRACRISRAQLERWTGTTSSGLPCASTRAGRTDSARVFEVVGGSCVAEAGASDAGELELRLGPWSVNIRCAGR